MDAESYRNNWQNLSEKLRGKYGDLSDEDLKRAETGESDLLDLLEAKYGLGHDEALKDFQSLMETMGQKVAPTVDPPKTADPQEDTAPPQ